MSGVTKKEFGQRCPECGGWLDEDGCCGRCHYGSDKVVTIMNLSNNHLSLGGVEMIVNGLVIFFSNN
jgi:hypothetical protein